jgi:hypothetical protein
MQSRHESSFPLNRYDIRGKPHVRRFVTVPFDGGYLEVTEAGVVRIMLTRCENDRWKTTHAMRIPPGDTLDAIFAAVSAGPDGRQAALSIALDYLEANKPVLKRPS